jgi:hypothetical protein
MKTLLSTLTALGLAVAITAPASADTDARGFFDQADRERYNTDAGTLFSDLDKSRYNSDVTTIWTDLDRQRY